MLTSSGFDFSPTRTYAASGDVHAQAADGEEGGRAADLRVLAARVPGQRAIQNLRCPRGGTSGRAMWRPPVD